MLVAKYMSAFVSNTNVLPDQNDRDYVGLYEKLHPGGDLGPGAGNDEETGLKNGVGRRDELGHCG